MKAASGGAKHEELGSCGNAEAVERVESQKQVSHFPLPLRDYDRGSDLAEHAGGLRPQRRRSALLKVIVVDREK
jgi:hypothetical protein